MFVFCIQRNVYEIEIFLNFCFLLSLKMFFSQNNVCIYHLTDLFFSRFVPGSKIVSDSFIVHTCCNDRQLFQACNSTDLLKWFIFVYRMHLPAMHRLEVKAKKTLR